MHVRATVLSISSRFFSQVRQKSQRGEWYPWNTTLLGAYGEAQRDGTQARFLGWRPQISDFLESLPCPVCLRICCKVCTCMVVCLHTFVPTVLSSEKTAEALAAPSSQEGHKWFKISHCAHVAIAAKSLKSLEVHLCLEHGYRMQPMKTPYIFA